MAIEAVRAPEKYKVVGTRPIRHDAFDKVTGKALYGADIQLPGMIYGKVLRSPHTHARIRSIDTSAAEAMAGVTAVFTGAQVAEFVGPVPIITPFPSPDHRAVVVDTIRYVGEAVAVVVATDRYIAKDAADAIVVDYDVLPAVSLDRPPAGGYPSNPARLTGLANTFEQICRSPSPIHMA